MNHLNIKKMSVSFGLLAFGVLSVGSVLMGATILTGIIRGVAGAIIFGFLAWLSGFLMMREDKMDEDEGHKEDTSKGTQLDQTA